MELNGDTYDRIEKYVRGKLPKAEAASLEKEMVENEAMREAVEMARFEMEGMEYLLEQDLREQMGQWKEAEVLDEKENPKADSDYGKWLWGLFGVVGLLLAIFYFTNIGDDENFAPANNEVKQDAPKDDRPIATDKTTPIDETGIPDEKKEVAKDDKTNLPNQPVQKSNPLAPEADYEELYAYVKTELYTSPSLFDDNGLKSPAKDGESVISKGKKAFVAGEYAKAVKLLESIAPKNNEYEAAKEPLAHAYFKNGQFAKATKLFKEITDESSFLKDEPEWYWLLSLMADYEKNKKEANQLLNEIIKNNDHQYHKQAAILKSKLEEIK